MSSKSRGGLSKREYEKKYGTSGGGGSSSDSVKAFKYSSKDEKKDTKKATEQVQPYYAQQIADTMEDLNAYIQTETTSYNRTMRRNRATMARQGTAVGSQRTGIEGETTADFNTNKNSMLQRAERMVGSTALTGGGFQSQYKDSRKGSINEEMQTAIEERKLYYKNQRAQEHYGKFGINYGKTA